METLPDIKLEFSKIYSKYKNELEELKKQLIESEKQIDILQSKIRTINKNAEEERKILTKKLEQEYKDITFKTQGKTLEEVIGKSSYGYSNQIEILGNILCPDDKISFKFNYYRAIKMLYPEFDINNDVIVCESETILNVYFYTFKINNEPLFQIYFRYDECIYIMCNLGINIVIKKSRYLI